MDFQKAQNSGTCTAYALYFGILSYSFGYFGGPGSSRVDFNKLEPGCRTVYAGGFPLSSSLGLEDGQVPTVPSLLDGTWATSKRMVVGRGGCYWCALAPKKLCRLHRPKMAGCLSPASPFILLLPCLPKHEPPKGSTSEGTNPLRCDFYVPEVRPGSML